MTAHRCHGCGKRRANITVVNGRDLCPECALERRREIEAAWRIDTARVERVLRGQSVPRQTRTIAKQAGLGVESTRVILIRSKHARRTPHGLWVAQ